MTTTEHQATSPGVRTRAFSFRSDKSAGSKGKNDLTESPKDKERRDSIWRASSKANPNAAIIEDQPGVANLLEKSTLQSLRDYQHKDAYGNLIADPDLSNPTRPRMERPLDTIRAFEKAIDNGYKRRSSYLKADPNDPHHQYASRRTSYLAHDQNRHSSAGGGFYGGQRPDSYMGANGGAPPRQRPYPQQGHQQSQDTVNTGATNGSDSTGPWANSTDPSSENSSVDRVNGAAHKPESHGVANGHGPTNNGYAGGQFQGPILEEQGPGSYGGAYPLQNGHGPAPPVQAPNGLPPRQRRVIPLGGEGAAYNLPPGKLPPSSRPEAEKRKSWLSRRFSKRG